MYTSVLERKETTEVHNRKCEYIRSVIGHVMREVLRIGISC